MGGLYNPLGTGVSPDGTGYVPQPPNIPDAPPPVTGPTVDAAKKGNDVKDQERAKPLDDRLKSWIPTKWMDLRTAYTVFHQLVWQNILFYVGMVWIQWDQNRRIWQPAVPEDEWTPQPIVNNFAPAADAVASIFQMPTVEATAPEGQVDNDDTHDVIEIANALAADLIKVNALENDYKTKEGKADIAGQLFVLSGNLLTEVCRKEIKSIQVPKIGPLPAPPPAPGDQLMGQVVQPPPTPQWGPLTDPITGQPVMETQVLYDADVKIVNPLFWLPRAGSTGIDDARYGQLAMRMSLDEIKDRWGYDAQPDNQFLDSMESSWEIALNFYYTGYSSLTQATKESALVVITFIEPKKVADIPEGGVAVMVNDIIIFTYSWGDYCMDGEWPLTHFGYLKAPTTFFKRTSMHDVAHIQKETNRYESIIALHAMTSAGDSLIIDKNTQVSNVTGRGDRIIYFRSIGPGSKEPHRLQHGSLDNGVYEQRQKLEDKIQNITGAVSVWRGQQAGSVTAASGISQLRGQAEQMFSKPTNNWKNGWVETIRKGVKLRQKVMQPPQIAEIVGPGHDVQIQKFKAANLDACINWVATAHGLPRTRDEKRNDLLALFDRGLLDVNDPNVRITINELFGETGLLTMFTLDATRARAENSIMEKGTPVQPLPEIEDMQVHIAIHTERVKKLDFDQLAQPIQVILIQHIMETKIALQAQMVQAAMLQAGGAGGGPGEGSAPQPPASPAGQGGPPGGGPHPAPPGSARPTPSPQGPARPAGGKKPPQARPGRPGPTNQISVPTGPNSTGGVK
jgi:hypothetical protein